MIACGASEPEPGLVMSASWVRAMPPGSSATSAYGTLTNQGKESIHIVSVASDSFSSAGLHETQVEHGVSRMKSHSSWTVEPGGHLKVQPGGKHFMLMQPTRAIELGSEITLTLVDESGKEYAFRLPVEAR